MIIDTSLTLRASETDPAQSKSIDAVYAALGLTAPDSLLQGCQPVIVEGTSDQFYLNGIKNYLIKEGLITLKRELVFMPSGGVRGVPALVSILTGKDDALPYVVLDSDKSGQDFVAKLKGNLYQGAGDRLLLLEAITRLTSAEVEALLPPRTIRALC